VRNVTFDLVGGEILGIAGVEGNGQAELVEALLGLRHPASGTLALLGKDIRHASPQRVRALGVSYVPADRLRRGVVGESSIAENIALGQHRAAPFATRGGWLSRRAMTRAAAALAERYDIRPPDPSRAVRTLSGGNQQKVVVAREFDREAVVLVCEQPTRGVDVGAIEFIHRRILAQRDAGRAVLLVSADLSELLALADRIAVMYDGRFVDMIPAGETNERELGLLMTGASPATRTLRRVESPSLT
jgi:simple sugar transport system ATP-binding protein